MPELPEVETIVRKLQHVLPGKTLAQVEVRHVKSLHGQPSELEGRQVVAVSRRAKLIQIELAPTSSEKTAPLFIVIHLKMTGQLIYQDHKLRIGGGHPTADWVDQLPGTHTRIITTFTDDTKLFFNDQRLFGWWKVVDAAGLTELHHGLGPDVNQPAFTAEYLQRHISKRRVPIKQVIMDNAVVCGIGNIYACDSLNLARIAPTRPANTLSAQEIEVLVTACRQVIEQGIALGGTTFDGKYVDIAGMAGKYQTVVRVYGREGSPCPNCGALIEKTKLAGRGTYFCPECQS